MDDLGSDDFNTLVEALRPEAASTPKGSARAKHIIEETLTVLIERGHQHLTLEEIARRVGIAKGNLQYYYPTRDDLLRAAFAVQIDRHRRDWQATAEQPARNSAERLSNLIAFELESNRDSRFVAQVLERHALARHDPLLRRLSDAWHRWVTGRYAAIIADLRPSLSPLACRQTAIAIYALMVGATPYTSSDPAIPEAAEGLDARLTAIALRMVESAR